MSTGAIILFALGLYLLLCVAVAKAIHYGNPGTEHPLLLQTRRNCRRQLWRWLGALLFVLLLNGAYTLAAACDGDYPTRPAPHPVPALQCRAC